MTIIADSIAPHCYLRGADIVRGCRTPDGREQHLGIRCCANQIWKGRADTLSDSPKKDAAVALPFKFLALKDRERYFSSLCPELGPAECLRKT